MGLWWKLGLPCALAIWWRPLTPLPPPADD